jgi:amino acid transporter
MSMRTLFGFSIGATTATYVFQLVSSAQITFPGADIVLALLVGALVTMIVLLPYMQLVGTMPRSGGDYVFASRVFSPIVGVFAGTLALGCLLLLNSFTADYVTTSLLPISLQTLGLSFAHGTFNQWAADIPAHHSTTFIVELVFVVLCLGAAMLPTKRVLAIIFGAFVLNVLGGVVLVFEFLTHSHADFQHAFNQYSNSPHAYAAMLAAAKHANVVTNILGSAGVKAIPLGIFTFTGMTFTVYNGGEIKGASKTFRNGTLLAVLAFTAFVLIEYLTLRSYTSYHFLAAANGLNATDPTAYAKITSAPAASGGMLYGALTSNVVFRIILAVAWVAGSFAALVTVLFACSRMLFAFSFDRLLPTALSDVNERLASPVKALLVVFVVTVALIAFNTFSTGLVTISSNDLLLFVTFWGISAAAATVLPWRRPELFKASPRVIRGDIFGIPVISIIGAITVVAMIVIFFITATNKSLSGGFTATSVTELLIIALLGPVIYLIARWRLRATQGIDLSLALRELPPE